MSRLLWEDTIDKAVQIQNDIHEYVIHPESVYAQAEKPYISGLTLGAGRYLEDHPKELLEVSQRYFTAFDVSILPEQVRTIFAEENVDMFNGGRYWWPWLYDTSLASRWLQDLALSDSEVLALISRGVLETLCERLYKGEGYVSSLAFETILKYSNTKPE